MEAKEHIKAWVDRKLFIHNFGHAAAAYMGFLKHSERVFLWEILEDEDVLFFVQNAMQQSANALKCDYPDVFTGQQLQRHIDDLLRRFSNRYLGDTVFRVGCDLYRKLSHDDRLVTPLVSAYRNGLPCNLIAEVVEAAFHFKAVGTDGRMFPADADFHAELQEKGKRFMLQKVCRFSENEISAFGF